MPASLRPMPVLILGGTTEAMGLCRALAGCVRFSPILSFAGATRAPVLPDIPVRIGGFGGAEGLCQWLRTHHSAAVIDATHPFAATMSQNAALACATTRTPLLRLERPAWQQLPQDNWVCVPTIQAAALALATPTLWTKKQLCVFLTTGRKETAPFMAAPQHHYVLRSIEAPEPNNLPPNTTCMTARGPFDLAAECATLRHYQFDCLVSKNSGGASTYPKIEAARLLGIPVIMVNRPAASPAPSVATPMQALHWLEQLYATSTLRDV